MSERSREDRYLRYSGLVDPQELIDARVLVLGVGAIGRQLALQLAAMGVGQIDLQDMDVVEEVNYGAQGYRPEQLGRYKVGATRADIEAINPQAKVFDITDRFEETDPNMHSYSAVFCCVDCMDARKALFQSDYAPTVGIDTRMSGYVAQLYYIDDENRQDYCDKFLFSNEDSYQEPCTARSTIFTSSVIAGMAVAIWAQSLRARPPYPFMDMSLNSVDWTLEPIHVKKPTPAPIDDLTPVFSGTIQSTDHQHWDDSHYPSPEHLEQILQAVPLSQISSHSLVEVAASFQSHLSPESQPPADTVQSEPQSSSEAQTD